MIGGDNDKVITHFMNYNYICALKSIYIQSSELSRLDFRSNLCTGFTVIVMLSDVCWKMLIGKNQAVKYYNRFFQNGSMRLFFPKVCLSPWIKPIGDIHWYIFKNRSKTAPFELCSDVSSSPILFPMCNMSQGQKF